PGKHPVEIPVNGGDMHAEADTGHCRRGIRPYPTQRQYVIILIWEDASKFSHNLHRSLLPVQCPGIISQPFPVQKDLVGSVCCQGGHIRKAFNKFIVVIQALLNPRLLKDNFAYPYLIGILCFSEW